MLLHLPLAQLSAPENSLSSGGALPPLPAGPDLENLFRPESLDAGGSLSYTVAIVIAIIFLAIAVGIVLIRRSRAGIADSPQEMAHSSLKAIDAQRVSTTECSHQCAHIFRSYLNSAFDGSEASHTSAEVEGFVRQRAKLGGALEEQISAFLTTVDHDRFAEHQVSDTANTDRIAQTRSLIDTIEATRRKEVSKP